MKNVRTIVNKYAKKCECCKRDVPVGEGFAYNDVGWKTVCSSEACFRKLDLPMPKAQEKGRITVDGKLFMPYNASALPLLRSIPGGKWNKPGNYREFSTNPGDLPRVIEIAEKLSLEIPDELRKKAAAGTPESREAELRAETIGLYDFQREGVRFLSLHDRALLADDMGLGKALVNGTPVLTPDGWQPIETLEVGDTVIGRNGKPVNVTGVFPQGKVSVFDVTFSDGRSISCCKEHLWAVQTPNDRARNPDKLRVMSMQEVADAGLEDHNGNRKWFIPLPEPIEHSEKDFPVHPYVLGALLANGSLARVITHHGLPEQRERLAEYGVEFEHKDYDGKWSFYVKNADNLKAGLKDLNLHGKNCYTKSIPEQYFFGSIEQRLLLLQGLVDNDGTVSKDGMVVEYNTASTQLADDVIKLVRSLGGVVTFSTRRPKYTYKGEIKTGSTDHRVRIKLPGDMCPVSIPFKKDRFFVNQPPNPNGEPCPRKYPPTLSFADVVENGEEDCTCISVDSSDHLYVAKDYIVTHNTVQALVALSPNVGVLIVAPASLKYNWRNEAKKWRPDFKVSILAGRGAFKVPEPNEIVITNYEILPASLMPTKSAHTGKSEYLSDAQLKRQLENVVLIVDEAHKTKNYKTAQSKKVSRLSRLANKVWFLTGTPLLNRPGDLFGVVCSGDMNVFGKWNYFASLFDGYKDQWGGWSFGEPDVEVAERLRRIMLRRLKKDVLKDLPPKTYQTITVNGMTKGLEAKLREIAIELAVENADDEETYEDIVARVDADLENVIATLGDDAMPRFEQFAGIRAELARSRIPAALEIVEEYEESDTPLLVFSAHKDPVNAVGGREGWAAITGDTPPKERQQIVDDFQSGKLKGVALTIIAGGVGLTLTRASHALFIDLDWTPALNLQAEDRMVRIGQLAQFILIKHMESSHPLDRHVQNLIREKMKMITAALEKQAHYESTPIAGAPSLKPETDEELAERLAALQAAEEEVERLKAVDRVHGILDREKSRASLPEPKLTKKRKELIRQALSFMVSRCDGAVAEDSMGFNKPDARIGHHVARTGLRDADYVTCRLMEGGLSRYYKTQLKGVFDEIWN